MRRDTEALHQKLNYEAIPNNTNPRWWLDPCLRINVVHLLGICCCLFSNAYNGSLLNGLQSLNEWQSYFGHPSSNTLGLMNSAGFFPGIVASYFADCVGQRLGRRNTIAMGTIILMVGVVIMALSTSVGMYCGGRAILGFGNYATLTMAPSLLQEIAHPRLRAKMGAFFMSIYYVAATISGAVCLGCLHIRGQYSWRIPVWAGIVSPAITLAMLTIVPESPRWLVKAGKHAQARHILVKYHANGKEDDDLVEHEYREIMAALYDETANAQCRYTDYLRTRSNRRRLIILLTVALGTNWVGNGIVGYYLSPVLASLGITSSTTQLQILIGMQAWNIVVAVPASMSVEWIGRRPLWIASTIGMLVTMVIIMALSAEFDETGRRAYGVAVVPLFFLFFGAYDIAWTPLTYSYPVEILPYSLRTKGQAIFIAVQTMAFSINTWVNPVALDAISWKYYAVYISFLCVILFLIWFTFPETKGLTIEEISLLFDDGSSVGRPDALHGAVLTQSRPRST